jgi:hypothetical protein
MKRDPHMHGIVPGGWLEQDGKTSQYSDGGVLPAGERALKH